MQNFLCQMQLLKISGDSSSFGRFLYTFLDRDNGVLYHSRNFYIFCNTYCCLSFLCYLITEDYLTSWLKTTHRLIMLQYQHVPSFKNIWVVTNNEDSSRIGYLKTTKQSGCNNCAEPILDSLEKCIIAV